MIYYLLGKSGSGKDTILKELLKDKELSLQPLILYTTRPIRPGEVDGREYHFISESQAEELESSDRLIEMRAYNTAYGIWKYMSYDTIGTFDKGAEAGQHVSIPIDRNYITIGTLQSYVKYVEYYGQANVVPIYIYADMEIRRERSCSRLMSMKNMGENSLCEQDIEEINRRLQADEADFSDENLKKCNIKECFDNSGELDKCVNEVKKYIRA